MACPASDFGLVFEELVVDTPDHADHVSCGLLRLFVIIVVLVSNMAMRTINV
jgi:predicted ATPase